MAVNVTEKDKTLNETIDWCEQMEAEGMRLASALLIQHDMDAYSVMQGQISAYEKTADHCRSLLGHSGPMPAEAPNQSEDATKKTAQTDENACESADKTQQEEIMRHDKPETMRSLEWLEHERRKAWQEGYTAGWKDQECDFPQYTTDNPYKETIE
nr:MAG: hypothetical protein [Bacteriophage sp.]